MSFDLKAARAILSTMSPLPWIVLEDENGQMTIIRNPNHPMHRDGMEAWGRKEASETPDAMGIAYMRENFGAALDGIERLQKALALKIEQHKGQAYVIGSYLGMLTDFNELNESQAKHIAELECEMETARQYIRDLEMKKNQTGLMNACENLSKTIEKQRTALKKLGQAKRERGKALVEERAISVVASLGASWEDLYEYIDDGELRSQNGYRKMAREQLHREGKL